MCSAFDSRTATNDVIWHNDHAMNDDQTDGANDDANDCGRGCRYVSLCLCVYVSPYLSVHSAI